MYVPIGAYLNRERARNPLLRNDSGILHEVGLPAGLIAVQPTDNAIWLDFDRDGYLDLYTGNNAGDTAPAVRNRLFRNQGEGTFADVTEMAGLNIQLHPAEGGTGTRDQNQAAAVNLGNGSPCRLGRCAYRSRSKIIS